MRRLDSYCVRVGSLNVGTVTGRGGELGGYDRNEKGWSVVCVRDWMEGEQSEIVGGGVAIWSGKSDQVMSIELGLEEMVADIICAYDLQVGCILLLPWLVPSSGVAGIADDLIPPCCPVCRVVLFQTHFCHVSLACIFPS